MTHFDFDRCDKYMYFASNFLPDNPVIVEVGSIHGAHGVKLWNRFNGRLKMIAYEAGSKNYNTLVDGVKKSCLPIITHNAAVSGKDGFVDFFEFQEISSNSIFPRHKTEGRNLAAINRIKSVSLKTIMADNDCDKIDLLFLNCEGAELSILSGVLEDSNLRDKMNQLCVSFHGGRVYPQQDTLDMVNRMSEFFWVVEEENDWPCHLFIKKTPK